MLKKLKEHRVKLIVCVCILAVLAFAFWYGGNAPGLQGFDPEPKEYIANTLPPSVTAVSTPNPSAAQTPYTPEESAPPETVEMPPALVSDNPIPPETGDTGHSEGQSIDHESSKDKYLTEPVPEGKPIPVEPQDAVISDKAYTCTLSVRCDTLLDNLDWLDKEKHELLPSDGIIFPATAVTFYEGESVFNVLQREMKKAKIHMEFTNTPIYNSVYIEGIKNLYEFDAGELSGWMYRVNGWFPNYGCSRYQLSDGDVIEWVYTCDLGADVGGYYTVGS